MNSAIIVHAHYVSSCKDTNHCTLMELDKIITYKKSNYKSLQMFGQ